MSTFSNVPFNSSDFTIVVNPSRARAAPDLTPSFHVRRSPPSNRYVLLLETSSSMDSSRQWRWVQRAAQRVIRHELPVDSRMAVVAFDNSSRTEHRSTRVSSDFDRSRLSDSVPDRYRLSRSDARCVLCAFRRAVHDVLGGEEEEAAGTHVILVTRGTPDTLSLTDEQVMIDLRLAYLTLPFFR